MLPDLTPEQIDSICLSYRHDFGLDRLDFGQIVSSGMTEEERNLLRFQVKEIYHAIRKELSLDGLLKDISTVESTSEWASFRSLIM